MRRSEQEQPGRKGARPRSIHEVKASEASVMACQTTSASPQDSRFSEEKWSCKAWLAMEVETRSDRETDNGFGLVENLGSRSAVRHGTAERESIRLPALGGRSEENGLHSDGNKGGATGHILPDLVSHSGKRSEVGRSVAARRNRRGRSGSLCGFEQSKTNKMAVTSQATALDRLKNDIYQSNLDREKQQADYLNKRRVSLFAAQAPDVVCPSALQAAQMVGATKHRRHTVCYHPAAPVSRARAQGSMGAEPAMQSLSRARDSESSDELDQAPSAVGEQSRTSLVRLPSPFRPSIAQPEAQANSATKVRRLGESLTEPSDAESIGSVARPEAQANSTTRVRWLDESFTELSDAESIGSIAQHEAQANSTTRVRWLEESLSEHHDAESIAALSHPSPPRTCRASSDPSNGKSLISRLLRESESQSDAIKEKVETFIKKENPAQSWPSLKLGERDLELKRFVYKAPSRHQAAPQRKATDQVINLHTCPSLNVFLDRSWVYSDREGKCRYLRGPATPVPPGESLFDKEDT